MLYTVYKTTNLINGKYYFGFHKTKNPYDLYLGSGKIILKAVAKYGKQAFRKDVLFIYPTSEQAASKEKELISAFIDDPLCYNLRITNTGEIYRPPTSEETRAKLRAAGSGKYERTLEIRKKASDVAKLRGENPFFRKTHSDETKQKMRRAKLGVLRKPPSEETRRKIGGAKRRNHEKGRTCQHHQ